MLDFRQVVMRKDGFTIIELLVVILITTIVMVIAARAFLFGNSQFLVDVYESKKLNRMILAKQTAEYLIQREIVECKNGSMSVRFDTGLVEAAPYLKEKFPEMEKVDFTCYEVSSKPGEIIAWRGNFQPPLIEYSSESPRDKRGFSVFGSVLK